MRIKPSPSSLLSSTHSENCRPLGKTLWRCSTTLPLHVNCYVHLNVDFSFFFFCCTTHPWQIYCSKLVPMTVDICQLMWSVVVHVHIRVVNEYCVQNSSLFSKSSKMLAHDLEVSTNLLRKPDGRIVYYWLLLFELTYDLDMPMAQSIVSRKKFIAIRRNNVMIRNR